MRINAGDKVTLSRTETKIVAPTNDYSGNCLYAEDGNTYHLEGVCPTAESRNNLWTVDHVDNTPADWPPQKDDVWEGDTYSYHIVGDMAQYNYVLGGVGNGTISFGELKGKRPVLKYRKK